MSSSVADRFFGYVGNKTEEGCILWKGTHNDSGYPTLHVQKSPGRRGRAQIRASRIAYQLVYGDFPSHLQCLHVCDNPACINPSHLFLGTPKDNSDDKIAKGRQVNPKGTQNGRAKLTEADVLAAVSRVRCRRATQAEVAKQLGVHSSTISRIVGGKKWGWLTGGKAWGGLMVADRNGGR